MAADLKRIGDRFWWYALIAALLSFMLGALAITRPVFIAAVLTQFVGASLLIEGVLDLISFLTLNKNSTQPVSQISQQINSIVMACLLYTSFRVDIR